MKKASALYLTLIIVSIVSSIAFGISSILFSQLKIIQGMGHSVIAFYAADSGIEYALYQARKAESFSGSYTEITDRQVVISSLVGEDPLMTIKSVGTYRGTKRGIQVEY